MTVADLVAAVGELPAVTRADAKLLERAIRNRQRSSVGVRAPWTSAEQKALIRMVEEGMPDRDIAEVLDRSVWSVRTRIRDVAPTINKTDRRHRWTPETEQRLIEMKHAGATLAAIAKEMNMNIWTVADKARHLRAKGRL